MSKRIVLSRYDDEIEGYIERLRSSAEQTQLSIAELSGSTVPIEFLFRLKFEATGCDPLTPDRPLNLIEQLNQTFTYLASFNAAKHLFTHITAVESLALNIGTKSGWDIESNDDGGLVAEVFAAVAPSNNQKLKKDGERVAASMAKHRYVFFMCPGCATGPMPSPHNNVNIWSLGGEL